MIRFFRPDQPFGDLTNFAPTPFEWRGKTFATGEHAFQWAKFAETDPSWAEHIRLAPTPAAAKQRGKSRAHPIHPDWDKGGEAIRAMESLITAKTDQNPRVAATLESTGDEEIGEANPWDSRWGLGRNGKGKNQLGKIWEAERTRRRG